MQKFIFILAALNLAYGVMYYRSKIKDEAPFKAAYPLFKEASDKLKASYVDEDKVKNENLTTGALKGDAQKP